MLASIEKLGGDGLADQLNHYNQYTGDPGYLPKDMERLRRVSAGRRAARRAHLAAAQRARAVVDGRAGRAGAAGPSRRRRRRRQRRPPAGAGINRDEAWRAQAAQGRAGAAASRCRRASRFQLANGLTVIHHYNPALPLVSAELVVKSGSGRQSGRPAGPGRLHRADAGRRHGHAQRAADRRRDRAAGRLPRHRQHARTHRRCRCWRCSSTFAQALDVLADVVQHPAFPTAEVERQRASRLGELVQQRDDPEPVAAVAAAGALYGAAPSVRLRPARHRARDPRHHARRPARLLAPPLRARPTRRWWSRATSRAAS